MGTYAHRFELISYILALDTSLMALLPVSFALRVVILGLALVTFYVLLRHIDFDASLATDSFKDQQWPMSSPSDEIKSNFSPIHGWTAVGYAFNEQVRLRDMSTVIAAWPAHAEDNVPTVPCLSADSHLLVLSASASQVRYGSSITFVMVYPTDVKNVLPRGVASQPQSSHELHLWCVFDDGSVTPAYSYDSKYGSERASLLDCPVSPFARDELWRYHRTLRVYLASMTDKNQNAPIAKAYVSVPTPMFSPLNSSQQVLTLCTSPLHNGAAYLTQWIQFHVLVGFSKFVVYNTTDTNRSLISVVNVINRIYPNLVDVVQWNFSSLGLTDLTPTRYFQAEAVHDCLIRYGDQSEWLSMLDLDEYFVPVLPYTTVLQYLHENFGHRVMGSVNLWSQFFCTQATDKYTSEENDTSRLVIERFVFRAADRHKGGREKYLYRPRFVQYLSIHHQIVGLSKEEPPQNALMLAHYTSMNHLRMMPGCNPGKYVNDPGIRNRFAEKVKTAMQQLLV